MKIFKSVLLLSLLALMTACGSGSNTAGVVGSNPYGNTTYLSGTQTGYGQINHNAYSIPGGTKTLTPILVGTVSSYGTKVYSISQTVSAGDQIIVNANGSIMYGIGAILGGFGSSNSSGYLNGLKVAVDGQVLGTSLYATYNIPAAGTLSIEGLATIMNIAKTSKTNFTTTFGNGVMLAHCVSTSGAVMTCPAGY